jgi:hypothetical protein
MPATAAAFLARKQSAELMPHRLPARVRDHEQFNLDHPFAESRGAPLDRYKPRQHQISKQLFIEAVGKHQGLGNAAWNLGKPSQGTVCVGHHRAYSRTKATEGKVTAGGQRITATCATARAMARGHRTAGARQNLTEAARITVWNRNVSEPLPHTGEGFPPH